MKSDLRNIDRYSYLIFIWAKRTWQSLLLFTRFDLTKTYNCYAENLEYINLVCLFLAPLHRNVEPRWSLLKLLLLIINSGHMDRHQNKSTFFMVINSERKLKKVWICQSNFKVMLITFWITRELYIMNLFKQVWQGMQTFTWRL